MAIQRRKAMFDRGAAALNALNPSVQDVYGCPLCLRGFSKDEVEAEGMLSEEHAPPESLGGEVVCLTCRDCNSSAGSQLDFHVKHREAVIDFLSGLDTDDLNARFTIGDVAQRGVVRMTGGAVRVGGVPKRDRPEIPGQMMDTLDALAESKQTDWSVQMEFQDRWQERRTRVGWLRSAYLVAFAALGYRYILRGALRRVASQIAAPDTDAIPLPVVWKPKGNPQQRAVLLVEDPQKLVSVLVQMGRNTVLLPGIDDDEEFFQRMHEVISTTPNYFQQEVHGKLVSWPVTMSMLLDTGAAGRGQS
jgi:hypothetical protein